MTRITIPPPEGSLHRRQRVAAWMLTALGLAAVATLAVVARYPYPDILQGYGAFSGSLMAALTIGGYVLWRRERQRGAPRSGVFRTIIWTSAFFLVLVAPTCIGTLASPAP